MIAEVVEKPERPTSKPVILWISRHKPLPAQLDVLWDKLGDYELITHEKPLSTAEDAVKLAREVGADYVIPVLPMSFIVRLVEVSKKERFKVLRAEMENIHNCTDYPCPDYNEYMDTIMESRDFNTGQRIYRHFRFKKFVILKDILIVTEDF